MKTKEQLEKKIEELITKEKLKYIEKRLKRIPRNCVNHHQTTVRHHGIIQYCKLKTNIGHFVEEKDAHLFICDSPGWAQKCEDYCTAKDIKVLEFEFYELIRNPELCSQQFPKLFALLWVLHGPEDSFYMENTDKPKAKESIEGSFLVTIKKWIFR